MRRVGHLLDQIRLNGESKELRDEIVELGTRYGIVTPYTSYLVLEPRERGRQMIGMAPVQSVSGITRKDAELPVNGRQPVSVVGAENRISQAEADAQRLSGQIEELSAS